MPNTLFERIYAKKWSFVVWFTIIYFLSLLLLSVVGLNPLQGTFSSFIPREENVVVEKGEFPIRIEIPSIGLKANVSNPDSTDINVLDQELLKGAVRYPQSGVPGEEGNVLLFGHSSYLPVVQNKAYKAFNDIQHLEEGAPIFVVGDTKVFVYAVEKVESANVSTGEIPLAVSGAKLTLATCDTFGAKSDRFIVTAKLMSVQEL